MIRPPEYEANNGISQSDLKTLEDNPFVFYKTVENPDPDYMSKHGLDLEKKSKYMNIGDIADVMLTDAPALKQFFVFDSKLSETIEKIVMDVYNKVTVNDTIIDYSIPGLEDLSNHKQAIIEAATAIKFQRIGEKGGWKEDTVYEKVFTDGHDYFSKLFKSRGKKMIQVETMATANITVANMKEDAFTGPYTIDGAGDQCQVALYGYYKGVALKGLLDKIKKNDKTRIIEPLDFKTSRDKKTFRSNYLAGKLYRQGAFYEFLLKENFPGYIIKPFKFVVGYTESLDPPEVIEMSPADLLVGAEGGTTPSGFHYKGWKDLINDLIWHRETGQWTHNREYIEAWKTTFTSFLVDADKLVQPTTFNLSDLI